MVTKTRTRNVPSAVLVVGDAAVFVLWAALGLAHHAEGITVAGLGRNAGYVALGWFAAAVALRTYTRRGVARFLATWAGGVTLGVVIRWIALRRPVNGDEFAFLFVTLVVTLVLLLAWRAAALMMRPRSRGELRPADAG
jgi:Protein of unknown function (DUF3054)